MRDHGGQLSFCPQLPPGWDRLRFRVIWRGARVIVSAENDEVSYEVTHCPDDGIEIIHCGETLRLVPGRTTTRPLPKLEPLTPRPTQPAGRKPLPADSVE
jgi:trehalose/maltose hydrolase-like predicted phosphorylase